MPKRIDKLTPKQEAEMPAYRDKWIEIGLRTGETDWETFNKYMSICYEKAGLQYPARVVHVPSPFFGAHVASLAHEIWNKRYKNVQASVRDSVESSVRDSVRASVRASVGDSVQASVRNSVQDSVQASVEASVRNSVQDSVGDSVQDSVQDSVEASVRNSVQDSVGASVGNSVQDSVGASVGTSSYEKNIIKTILALAVEYDVKTSWNYWLGGQFWVGGWYWGVAFVNFFFDVCKLKLSQDIMERAEAYRKVCESVNYIWPNRDFVIVCARPKAIHRNTQGRLHNEHGMAIQYPDGWGLYLLNGVRFPEELYLKVISRNMEMSEILNITDIDQRVQAMKFAKNGLREFYQSEGGTMIDQRQKLSTNSDIINYELWKLPAGKTFNKEVHFMIYDCPSAKKRGEIREYAKGVPAFSTVAEAMSWGVSDDNNTLTPSQWDTLIPLRDES